MFQPFFAAWMNPPTPAQPELEVLRRTPAAPSDRPPVVLVHGAYVGAWCWERYFLPHLADRGFDVHAVSLRGHAGSGGDLQGSGIREYVADLSHVVSGLSRPPILIGHSMGGLVVQRYLETGDAAAAVLMASVPPAGLMRSTLRLMFGDPMLFTQMSVMQGLGPTAVDLSIARRALFSAEVPRAELAGYTERSQQESQRAIWDMTAGNLPRPWRVRRRPMLVLGAENDALFSPAEIRATADRYGAECHIEPDMAHAMMLEPGWRGVADRVADWAEGVSA